MAVKMVYEASELGWAPGFVPGFVLVDGIEFNFSNNLYSGDEVSGWEFFSSSGDQLIVFND